ncbi:MAG: TIGR01777 family oxidoreductase [Chitinophagaceae bacterium]
MNTILITGGTGLVGNALTKALISKGYSVIILTRQKDKQSTVPNLSYGHWDIGKMVIDKQAFAQVTHIIHLAGAGVADKRWTKKRKQEIIDSRVKSGELLVQCLKNIPNKVQALISASAIGWYGADPEVPNPNPFKENDKPAPDFLGTACKIWEESTKSVAEMGKRLVHIRIGIVLSNSGGALKEFMKPQQFGIAAILGNGKQVISWIHLDDLVQLFIKSIEDETMLGAYNAVAPNPVSNKELTITLATARDKFYIPVYIPSFLLKIVLGEMSVEVLKSATVSAEKLLATGFQFNYLEIESALRKETVS